MLPRPVYEVQYHNGSRQRGTQRRSRIVADAAKDEGAVAKERHAVARTRGRRRACHVRLSPLPALDIKAVKIVEVVLAIRAAKEHVVTVIDHTRMPEARAGVAPLAVHQPPLRLAAVVHVHVVGCPRTLAAEDHKGMLIEHRHCVPPAPPRPFVFPLRRSIRDTCLAHASSSWSGLVLPSHIAESGELNARATPVG